MPWYRSFFKAIIPVMSYGRKPLIIIVIGRVGVAIASLATVRVTTTYLLPNQIGSLTELNSFIYLINLLLVTPIGHFINRGFLEWADSGNLLRYIKLYFLYLILIAFFSFLLSSGMQAMFHIFSEFSIFQVGILISLLTFLQPIFSFATTGLNLFNERSIYVIFSNLVPWFTLFFSIVFFYRYGNLFSWGFGQVISLCIGCTSLFFLMKKISKVNIILDQVISDSFIFSKKSIFNFSWPILITSIFWWIQSNSYRFVLDKIQGTSVVGLFAIAYGLAATPIGMYESIISQYLDPIFFSDLKQNDREGQVKAWNNYAKLYLPGLVLTCLFIILTTPYLARILLGQNEFRKVAIQITAFAALVETMRATGSLMFHLGMAKKDNRMTIIPVAAGALLTPLGVFYFGKWNPLYGTAFALLIASTVILILIIYLSRKVLPITWPFKKVINVLLTSIPLIFGLIPIRYYFPDPSFLFSLIVLIVSGMYTGLVLLVLIMKNQVKEDSILFYFLKNE